MSPFPFSVSISLCDAAVVLVLVIISRLYFAAHMVAFLAKLLKRMFILPSSYYM